MLATQASQEGNEIKHLYREAGVSFSPGCLRVILPVISGSILSQAVTSIKGDERFTDGGILWFKDLTQPDRYFVLPAIQAGLSFLNHIFITSTFKEPIKNRLEWLRRWIIFTKWSPLLGFLVIAFTRKGPNTAMTLYHITSSSLELTEEYLIKKLITDSD